MIKIIVLTEKDGTKIYVNANNISYFVLDKENFTDVFIKEYCLKVRESPQQIMGNIMFID